MSGIYECTGCGRVTRYPDKDLELIRAAGGVSCCPERNMVPHKPRVKPLVWHEEPVFEVDEYGCKEWGEFSADSIVATCETIYCGIYRHSFDKFMWVDGTLDNIRYSTYRKPPVFEKVEIPWLSSIDLAKAAAQADYERRILEALE